MALSEEEAYKLLKEKIRQFNNLVENPQSSYGVCEEAAEQIVASCKLWERIWRK